MLCAEAEAESRKKRNGMNKNRLFRTYKYAVPYAIKKCRYIIVVMAREW